MFILKVLFAPLSLILPLFIWLCAGAVLFRLRVQAGKRPADYLLHHPPYAGVSENPMGSIVQDVNAAMKNFIHSTSRGRIPRLAFLKSLFTFLLISDIILARRSDNMTAYRPA